MYNSTPYTPAGGLGFSLKPPDWLRKIVGAVVKGTTVSVPTDTGIPITVDLSDPAAVAKLKAMLTGTKISTTVGTAKPSVFDTFKSSVETIPGGWLTIAAVAAGAIFILPQLMGRRGR